MIFLQWRKSINKIKLIKHNLPRNYSFVSLYDINNQIRLKVSRPDIEGKISDYWGYLIRSQHSVFGSCLLNLLAVTQIRDTIQSKGRSL